MKLRKIDNSILMLVLEVYFYILASTTICWVIITQNSKFLKNWFSESSIDVPVSFIVKCLFYTSGFFTILFTLALFRTYTNVKKYGLDFEDAIFENFLFNILLSILLFMFGIAMIS